MTDRELLDEAYRIALNALGAYEAFKLALGEQAALEVAPGLDRVKERCERFIDAYQEGDTGRPKNFMRFAHTLTPSRGTELE